MSEFINLTPANFFEKTFLASQKKLPGHHLPWLVMSREKALEKIASLPVPNRHQEEWKYTPVQQLYQTDYKNFLDLNPEKWLNLPNSSEFHQRLITKKNYFIFIDGQLAASQLIENSHTKMLSFEKAFTENTEWLKSDYAILDSHSSPFTAANQALAHAGIIIQIPPDVRFENPIECLFIVTEPMMATHLHHFFHVGKNAQVNIIERYLDLSHHNHWNNVITHVVAEENSQIEHIKIIEEGQEGHHIATTFCEQFEKSAYTHQHFTLSGKLVRSDLEIFLTQSHTMTHLLGLYVGKNAQHIDHHTTLNHNATHTESHQLYKGILKDKSSAVFNGKIKVAHGAAHTIAHQLNHNLLLSRQAEINTKPQLEIFTDEVQCTHGATIGQLSKEALFYLQSRGIAFPEANAMLTDAFAAEMLNPISDPLVKHYIKDTLSE